VEEAEKEEEVGEEKRWRRGEGLEEEGAEEEME
jgi:hypothetical protein